MKNKVIILLGILLLAAAVRLWGIDYGLPCTYCRPDEDRLISTALRLSYADPNPHYFIWPGLFFYLTRGILEVATQGYRLVAGGFTGSARDLYVADPAYFHLVLRYIFCGFGVATIYLIYRLGRQLFSSSVGLIAAFFLSLTFLHVRDSHFAMLDIPATLLGVGSLLAAWIVYRRGRWRDYLMAGVLLGLATATKYYAVILFIPLITAYLSRRGLSPVDNGRGRGIVRLLIALITAAGVFFLTSPYTLLDLSAFLREIRTGIISPQLVDGFPLLPEMNTPRGWLYHITFSFRYGLGWPLEILSLLGVGYAIWRVAKGAVPERLILSFVLPFYLLLAFQKSCFIRYTTLLIPFLCLLGGHLLQSLRSRGKSSAGVVVLLAVVIMVEPSIRVVGLDRLLSRPDTRNLAGDWMEKNIPTTAIVFYPQPFIFGRPEGFFRYPNRVNLSPGIDPETFRKMLEYDFPGEKYTVIHESSLSYSSPDPEIKRLLEETGECGGVSTFLGSARGPAVFDPFDAFYVPLAGFSAVDLPGPTIRIYRFR